MLPVLGGLYEVPKAVPPVVAVNHPANVNPERVGAVGSVTEDAMV
jgi:hypothetical protein